MVKSYLEFSLEKTCLKPLVDGKNWGAYFKLDQEVRGLFPYINAVIPYARYSDQPESIQFIFESVRATLYPREVVAAPFSDREEAQTFFSHLVEFLNDLHNRRKDLRPNHRLYRPLSVLDVLPLLPNSNCGECGYPTCLAFASALRQGRNVPEHCPGFSPPIYEKAVYPIFDQDGSLASTVTIEINPNKRRRIPESISPPLTRLPEAETIPKAPPEPKPAPGRPPLTGREIQILRLLAEGATNPDISERLAISPHTVKSHVIHIFNKLGVNDRTQAAVWAARHNII